STLRNAYSPARTCWKVPGRSSRRDRPSSPTSDRAPRRYQGKMTAEQKQNIERFGVFLPSFVWDGDGAERAQGIRDFAREVEDIGFDSIFITDHLLAAKQFYSVSFLEPFTALALVAGVTDRVKLGTSVMV